MRTPFPRRLVLALGIALSACGGGGSDPAPAAPSITRFEAVGGPFFVGDTARVRAEFSGGSGRITPDALNIASGTELSLGPVDRSRTLRLVVSQVGQPDASRDLSLSVDFRDRYQAIDLRFSSSHHSAVAAADGTVLLIGGSRGQNALAHQVDRYDPRTNSIVQIGSLREGRAYASATRLGDGRVLVAGGEMSGNAGPLAELIDERTGAVSDAGRMSVSRVGHAALLLADGKVLVSGGVSAGEGAGLGLSRSVEVWDPATRSFRRLGNGMLEPRTNHSMSLLPDGRVLIVGGFSNGLQPLFAEIFDPRTEQFSPVASNQTARAEHAAFTQADGKVLIVGGEKLVVGQADWAPTASVLRFDPATSQFTELPPLSVPRTLVQGALLPNDEVLLFGGRHIQAQNSFGAERYNPATGGRAIARLDAERAHHTVTRLASGRVAVIGGENRSGTFAPSVRVYE